MLSKGLFSFCWLGQVQYTFNCWSSFHTVRLFLLSSVILILILGNASTIIKTKWSHHIFHIHPCKQNTNASQQIAPSLVLAVIRPIFPSSMFLVLSTCGSTFLDRLRLLSSRFVVIHFLALVLRTIRNHTTVFVFLCLFVYSHGKVNIAVFHCSLFVARFCVA